MSSQEHFDKYEAMAQRIGIDKLIEAVPVSAEHVRAALAKGDEHLNSIPLAIWDKAVGYSQMEMGHRERCPCCGQQRQVKWNARQFRAMNPFEDGPHSAAERVCLLKHVARYHLAKES